MLLTPLMEAHPRSYFQGVREPGFIYVPWTHVTLVQIQPP